jgi:hypothetical protein
LLLLREFKGLYSGKEQARVFLDIINEAKLLKDLLRFFIIDNIILNNKMLHYIAKEINRFDPIL